MLACQRRLASSFSTAIARSTLTSINPAATSTPQTIDKPRDTIFTTPESPWDHVFSDIEPTPPSAQRIRSRLGDGASPATGSTLQLKRQRGVSKHQTVGSRPSSSQSFMQHSSAVRQQRASITAREMSVFDEMFDMIFSAVSAQDGKKAIPSSSSLDTRAPSASTRDASPSTPSIGRTGTPLNDIFRTLRRQSRIRWTTAIDEELDRKKETMELFNTDYDLLQWVTKEVFGEVEEWGEEAKRAMTATPEGVTKGEGEEKKAVATTPSSPCSLKGGPSKHSIYPHLIAHAMRIFRTTYSNPSLSLAIFNHAARASIPSYVFGCTAPAYNELIEAKWEGWGDLEGVCNALEEMRANGVKIDGRTRIVVEKVRREVGEARPGEVLDDAVNVNLLAKRVWEELGETEVMRLLHHIERLALRERSRKSTSSPHTESWKSAVLQPADDDGWSFDGWDKGDTKKRRGKTKQTPRNRQPSRMLDDWTVPGTPGEGAFR